MNRLEKLMQELCPNGVEWKTLGEVCVKTSNIRWKENDKEYYYIDLSSVNVENHQIEEPRLINRQNAPSRAQQIILQNDILFGTTRPLLKRLCLIPSEYNNQICSTAFCILRADARQLLPQYLYFLLSIDSFYAYVEKNQEGAGYPAISDTKIFNYTISVPPLPVQEEIVRILETYKKLQEELKANLQNELEAHKTQYEYYRNHLFDFEGVEGVEWKELGEVASYSKGRINCASLNKGNYVGVENLLQDRQGKIDANTVPRVGTAVKFYLDDILIGNIRPYLKKIWLATSEGGASGDVLVFSIKDKKRCLPRFLYYILSSDDFFEYDNKNAKGGKMPRGDKDMVLKYRIPLPPLPVQRRIVSILDRFDALLNDLAVGIPAEIEAVTRQYEYYRDKLLTFGRP